MNKVLIKGTIAVFVCVPLLCKLVKEDPKTALASSVADLEITELAGWVTDTFRVYRDADQLASEAGFNGEAWNYEGLGESSDQNFKTATGANAYVCVLDFVTAEQASSQYVEKRDIIASGSAALSFSSYQQSEAVFFQMAATYEIYAAVGRFMIRMTMSGIADSQSAKTTAEMFLDIYKLKISG